MSREAMTQALEALEYIHEGANNQGPHTGISWRCVSKKSAPVITALRQALANEALDKKAENARELGLDYEPAQRKPVAWKLVPREPTHEMLKAMDECSTEGYDERLYAGHAASVYMAAVDAAPTPPAQRTWVGLTDEEIDNMVEVTDLSGAYYYDDLYAVVRAAEAKLRGKNEDRN